MIRGMKEGYQNMKQSNTSLILLEMPAVQFQNDRILLFDSGTIELIPFR